MKHLSLKAKLLLIVGIFAIGGTIYGSTVNAAMRERLEDSDYRSVMALRDLNADILPPPMYALEAYSVAREMTFGPDSDRAELLERWRSLESERKQRELFWSENAAESGIAEVLPDIKEWAGVTGRTVFRVGNEQLLPALAAGDRERTMQALDEVKKAYYDHRATIDQLVARVAKETEKAEQEAAAAIGDRKRRLILIGLAALLLGGAGATLMAQSISRRARALGEVLDDVANGDLTRRARVDSSDELGRIAEQLNTTLGAVERSFREVGGVAVSLAQTAPALARSSDEISRGAQQQAASLEETAASLEQITAAIKQSAGNAQQASHLAQSSREVAERGGHVVDDAVRAMNEIRTSSRRIADIITTIDEVALQTNLLALNAAVEAARAGELGRGFAVVAAEVGNLAQRSAAAAKEVKSLIEDSLQRVEAGHELVDQSGKSLRDIILSVKKVTDVVGEIAAAAREQSVGVDQVNQAVSQMDQVTQGNAAQTQELTRTAEDLSSTSQHLRELVERYRLKGESAAAAHAYPRERGPMMTGRSGTHRTDAGLSLAENDNQHSQPHQAASSDFEVV